MGQIVRADKSKDFKCYASADLVEGRTILDVTYIAGSYGMGGYGFLGLKLEASGSRSEEWLVCTLWSADNWMTVDGRWLASHPGQYEEQKPLHGFIEQYGERKGTTERWDEFKPLVLNRELKKFECEQHWCRLSIGKIVVEIEKDSGARPIMYGNKLPRALESGDDLRWAWILARDSYLPV